MFHYKEAVELFDFHAVFQVDRKNVSMNSKLEIEIADSLDTTTDLLPLLSELLADP